MQSSTSVTSGSNDVAKCADVNQVASNVVQKSISTSIHPLADVISRVPPPKAKIKGRTMEKGEVQTLGANGPKLCSQNCCIYGVAIGHNFTSYPQNPKKFETIAKLVEVRKKGRPKVVEQKRKRNL